MMNWQKRNIEELKIEHRRFLSVSTSILLRDTLFCRFVYHLSNHVWRWKYKCNELYLILCLYNVCAENRQQNKFKHANIIFHIFFIYHKRNDCQPLLLTYANELCNVSFPCSDNSEHPNSTFAILPRHGWLNSPRTSVRWMFPARDDKKHGVIRSLSIVLLFLRRKNYNTTLIHTTLVTSLFLFSCTFLCD